MSDELAPAPRYPLGLPAGSIRSILSLMVVGMICTLMIVSTPANVRHIPPYLVYLLFLILGSLFAAHGASMNRRGSNEPNALYLPGWTVRFLIIVVLIATVVWKLTQDPEGWTKQLEETGKILGQSPHIYMPFIIFGGFFVGVLARAVFGGRNPSVVYQDVIAWVSLLAMIGMLAAILITLVIVPSIPENVNIDFPTFGGILGGVIAFYFGTRS